MTGSKVLIVKLPELHADVKALEAFRAYVCDALGAGALVLPLGTTYAVEDFPALGAVMVEPEAPVPIVLGGPAPTPAGGGGGLVVGGCLVRSVPESDKPEKSLLPDIPAAEGVSRPEPKPVEPPPTRPPAEAVNVPKPTEIKLPAAVGQATPRPRFAGKASSEKGGHPRPAEPVLVGKGPRRYEPALRSLRAGRLEALLDAAQRREV